MTATVAPKKTRKPRRAPDPVDQSTIVDVNPAWDPILVDLHMKVIEINGKRDEIDGLLLEMDDIVFDAIEDQQPYRDIAEAGRRSVSWVQATLRRIESRTNGNIRIRTPR